MHVSMVATAIMQLRTMGFNGILVTQKCLTPGDLFSLALYTPIQGEAVPFSCNNISGRNYILRKLFLKITALHSAANGGATLLFVVATTKDAENIPTK